MVLSLGGPCVKHETFFQAWNSIALLDLSWTYISNEVTPVDVEDDAVFVLVELLTKPQVVTISNPRLQVVGWQGLWFYIR